MATIALDSAPFDPQGSILLECLPSSQLSAGTRRITRTATLDGNSSIVDNGYTASDNNFVVNCALDQDQELIVNRLLRLYPEVIAATDSGCYIGAISYFRKDQSGNAQFEFIIQRALSIISDLI